MNEERRRLYEELDPTFVDDLITSQAHVAAVAAWLRSLGRHVTVHPVRIRPSVEDMAAFSDNGDLEVNDHRIEVKQRMIDFTSANDFPYPTVIVDVAHTWDRASPKPHAYILTNRNSTHCSIVLGDSSPQWLKTRRFDHGKHRHREFYECPIRLARFYLMTPPSTPIDPAFPLYR